MVADDFNRRHFRMHFFLGSLRVKAVFRVDVNDVKLFQKITGSLRADDFHDPQSMPRIKKKHPPKKRLLIQILLFLTMFQQFTTGVRLVMGIPE